MNLKHPALWISIFVIALFAELGVIRAQTGGNAEAVAAVTKIENEGVKADLANDKAFYQKYLAEDWTGGDSGGTLVHKSRHSENVGRHQEQQDELRENI